MKSNASIKRDNLVELIHNGIPAGYAMELQRLARILHRYHEHACNYGLSERQERRAELIEALAKGICAQYNSPCTIQNDPRGWPIILGVEEDAFNAPRVCPY